MRRRNSASSSSGTFTRNGRIPVWSAGSSLKTAAVRAVDVRDMRNSFLEEGWSFAASRQWVRPDLEMRPLDGLRDAAELEHSLRHVKPTSQTWFRWRVLAVLISNRLAGRSLRIMSQAT